MPSAVVANFQQAINFPGNRRNNIWARCKNMYQDPSWLVAQINQRSGLSASIQMNLSAPEFHGRDVSRPSSRQHKAGAKHHDDEVQEVRSCIVLNGANFMTDAEFTPSIQAALAESLNVSVLQVSVTSLMAEEAPEPDPEGEDEPDGPSGQMKICFTVKPVKEDKPKSPGPRTPKANSSESPKTAAPAQSESVTPKSSLQPPVSFGTFESVESFDDLDQHASEARAKAAALIGQLGALSQDPTPFVSNLQDRLSDHYKQSVSYGHRDVSKLRAGFSTGKVITKAMHDKELKQIRKRRKMAATDESTVGLLAGEAASVIREMHVTEEAEALQDIQGREKGVQRMSVIGEVPQEEDAPLEGCATLETNVYVRTYVRIRTYARTDVLTYVRTHVCTYVQ
eukprot:gnl/MRDRNA2_/MRDRNA2_71663_c0_seq4.p1 gnl/MRDRNA2_/MRDRNA2_71663_c0~~gnl/MRDRNA2_/MRDRNA2_71663_c0_seq4.p1  ORF type:complete len:406 (+),score=90.40 gnl/MRDRNA2_/MRDRNA2_71663_c0_seq4:31-1218(+)